MLLGYFMKEENSTFNNYNGTTLITPSPTYQRSEGIVKWNGIQLQDVFSWGNNYKFIAGADYNEATSRARGWSQANAAANFVVTETSPSTPWSYVKTYAPFVQAHITTLNGKLIINPGARYDFINFGISQTPLFKNLTPKKETNQFFSATLGLQYNITSDWAIHSNIGRAFRFAQAFEIAGYYEEYLAGNKVRITTGNPHLKNEQSVTGDVGLKYNNLQNGIHFDVTGFFTNVNNRVKQVTVDDMAGQIHEDGRTIDRYLTYTNADASHMRGLEFEGGFDLGAFKNYNYGLRFFINATWLIKAEDITKGKDTIPDAAVRIRNVAPWNSGYGIEYDNHKGWVVRLSGRYLSKRYAQDFGNTDAALRGAFMEYPRYMVMDLTTNYTIANQHMLSLRVSNVTDENYYETRGYNLPGRSIGLRYTYRF
jgi:outer membrane receptor protein involved in Fe transport